MSEYIDVKLTLPKVTAESLDAITEQGLLGDTRDEVVAHILRQYMYDENLRWIAESGRFNHPNTDDAT